MLVVIDLSSYKILKIYKYSGYTSCFYGEKYAILNEYNKIKLYNINDYTFSNDVILNYTQYHNINDDDLIDDDIEYNIKKSINIKLLNINNNLYLCNVSYKYYRPKGIIIIDISKRIIYSFQTDKHLIFNKGSEHVVMVSNEYMMYYNNNHILTKINHKYPYAE